MLKSGVGCLRKVEMGWSCHDWPTGPMVGFCARPTHLILSVIAGEPPNLNPQQQQLMMILLSERFASVQEIVKKSIANGDSIALRSALVMLVF